MIDDFSVTFVKHFCPSVSFYGALLRERIITLPDLDGVPQHGYW